MPSFLAGLAHRDKMAVVEGSAALHIVVMIKETADPLALFAEWYGEAEKTEPNDPTALSLATVGPDGMPSLRMVLLKGFDAQGFVFYTNYQSRKGRQLVDHPKAAMLFHWKSLRRQVRLEGPVSQTTPEEADAYFATRARGSQIGAWASDQSRPLESRFALEKRVAEFGATLPGRQGAAAAALVGLPPAAAADRVLAGPARSGCTIGSNTAVRPRRRHGRHEPCTPDRRRPRTPPRLMRWASIASMSVATVLIAAKTGGVAGHRFGQHAVVADRTRRSTW